MSSWCQHFLGISPKVNAKRRHWWLPVISIGSGNGLVPSSNKPLPEPMLTQICHHMALLCHNKLNYVNGSWKLLHIAKVMVCYKAINFCSCLSGEYEQLTDWHRIVVFRPGLRDAVANNVKKGYVLNRSSFLIFLTVEKLLWHLQYCDPMMHLAW